MSVSEDLQAMSLRVRYRSDRQLEVSATDAGELKFQPGVGYEVLYDVYWRD